MNILKGLNKEQKKAAKTFDGPLLILAGAGSGKTKTIITRTANMILNGIDGNSILTLTFTNKAAKEMQERGVSLLNSIEDITYSLPEFTTFHSWALRFLKSYISYSDEIYPNFTIADTNVSESVLSDVIKNVYGGKNKTDLKESNLLAIFSILQNNLINYKKEEDTCDEIFLLIDKYKKEKRSLNFLIDNNVNLTFKELKLLSMAFVEYKSFLRKANMVDFDDLINLSISLLENNKDIQKNLHARYNYIMVDEFQDTNYSQIKLLDLILNKNENICVVGDNDQSIYGWRGAEISYILNFHKKYKNVTVINLTKNYRSTANILSKANKLLDSSNEKHSLKEFLKAFRKDSGKIMCSELYNDIDESNFVTKEINKLLEKGVNPNEIAILYRSNFIVNSLEKALIKGRVPYQIFKGRSILSRKSSVEFMSLINYILNPKNYIALEMFICSTMKIISSKKLEEIKEYCFENNISIIDFFEDSANYLKLKISKPNVEKLNSFFIFINEIRILIKNSSCQDIGRFIFDNGFIFQEYERIKNTSKSEKTVKDASSSLNTLFLLLELMSGYENLETFVEDVSLSSETEDSDADKVNLMTVHASKGLEFEYVFIVRFNNEIFPTKKSMANFNLLEEERRLAYVAITRAKVFLSISFVNKTFNGFLSPSRFLREAGFLKKVKKVSKYDF